MRLGMPSGSSSPPRLPSPGRERWTAVDSRGASGRRTRAVLKRRETAQRPFRRCSVNGALEVLEICSCGPPQPPEPRSAERREVTLDLGFHAARRREARQRASPDEGGPRLPVADVRCSMSRVIAVRQEPTRTTVVLKSYRAWEALAAPSAMLGHGDLPVGSDPRPGVLDSQARAVEALMALGAAIVAGAVVGLLAQLLGGRGNRRRVRAGARNRARGPPTASVVDDA